MPGCPTDTEWGLTPTGTQGRLAGAPPGTVLALPAAAGSSVLYVADDELWLADTSSLAPAVMAAGPLYSSVAPNGYYGEVDWSASFSWSLAPVARQVSAQLIGEGSPPQERSSPEAGQTFTQASSTFERGKVLAKCRTGRMQLSRSSVPFGMKHAGHVGENGGLRHSRSRTGWFEAPRVSIKLGLLQPGAAAHSDSLSVNESTFPSVENCFLASKLRFHSPAAQASSSSSSLKPLARADI